MTTIDAEEASGSNGGSRRHRWGVRVVGIGSLVSRAMLQQQCCRCATADGWCPMADGGKIWRHEL